MSEPEAPTLDLESHIAMPNGGVALRCQRLKRNGEQCAKPSRRGGKMCSSHGAGYASREASGERKKPGRPIQHGVYSITPTSSYTEVMEEVASLEDMLTSSDRDLLALKAALVMQISKLDALTPDVKRFEDSLEQYVTKVATLNDDALTPTEARWFVREFASWLKPLSKIDKAVNRISDGATKSIVAHKTRAETSAKLAETEGLAVFMQLNSLQRAIFHALAPDKELTDAYESALLREVYGPQRLEVPPLDMNVLAYPVEKLESPAVTTHPMEL